MRSNKSFIWKIIIVLNIAIICFIYMQYIVADREHKVFGVTYMTMNNPFYKIINNEILKIVEEHNDVLITLDPALDIEKQNEQIYDRHIGQAKELYYRNTCSECVKNHPCLEINPTVKDFYNFTIDDFKMKNYPLAKIKEENPQLILELGI